MNLLSEWLSKGLRRLLWMLLFVRNDNVNKTKLIKNIIYVYLEKKVDGDAFLLLNKKQIKEQIKVVGLQVKFSDHVH